MLILKTTIFIIEIDKQEVMIPVHDALIIKVMEKEKIIQLHILKDY